MNEWIKVTDRLPIEDDKILAIFRTELGLIYNMRHDGWFKNTIYSCRYENGYFLIESHGPKFVPTHWMPLPEPPKE